jgi:hypothetical protein
LRAATTAESTVGSSNEDENGSPGASRIRKNDNEAAMMITAAPWASRRARKRTA